MLQAIRTRAGGIIVKVLFGLLIVSFGFWGIYTRSPFSEDKSPDAAVATVGSRDIRADTLQAVALPGCAAPVDLASAPQLNPSRSAAAFVGRPASNQNRPSHARRAGCDRPSDGGKGDRSIPADAR